MLVVTGGFVTTASGLRFSARSPIPAFAASVTLFALWFAFAWRAHAVVADLDAFDRAIHDHHRAATSAVALAATLVTLLFNSFSATGSDASGYLSHAMMLLNGRLDYSEPLARIAKWPGGEATLAPLGWRSIDGGLQVPTYAVGLPLLIAPAHAIGGSVLAIAIVPVLLALSVVAASALAHRLGGATAALIAAVWLATSPIALFESMQLMSDVPVTAFWLLCWWLVFRRRSLAAGIAGAVAVLIRPNLAPLALVPAAYLAFADRARDTVARARWRDVFAFGLPVAAAGAVIAYLQWRWFGSPLRSGYGSATEIYSWSNVASNAALYTRWLVETHGPWLLAAPLALLVGRRRGELVWLLVFAAAVVAAYLAYSQFESWPYLRFLLPAIAAAIVATAVLSAAIVAQLPAWLRGLVFCGTVIAVASANVAAARSHDVFRFAERHVRARTVGERLADVLPVNAAIVGGEQSGSMRYYTGRSILRWDLIDDAAMRDAVDWLTLNGYQVWVVLDDWEEEAFRRRVPALAAMTLDYEPAVESAAGVGIRTRAWRARRFSARSSNSE